MPLIANVQLSTADDAVICQVVLYYLNSFHMYEEIKEMECLQFLANFERQWKYQQLTLNVIVEMWDLSGGSANSTFFCNKKVWRSWVQVVHDLIADWDGFECWDWGKFSNVKTMEINKLSGSDLFWFTACLLTFFIQSFVWHLGYYSLSQLHPPSLASHTCVNHRKRFGNGLINLPFPVIDPYL